MRPPLATVRHSSSPDLKEEDLNATVGAGGLTLWALNRLTTPEESEGRIDVDLDAGIEEDAMRFFELPVESTGIRRRRLLHQFCDNTKQLDAWLRRTDTQQLEVLPGEPSDVSEPRSSRRRPPERGRLPRQMVIRGSVRKGYGIRKPRMHAELSEELHLSREEDEMMMHWESRWREQELEQQALEARAEGAWCRTPSFGAEAVSPSSEQDDFAEEVRAICGESSLDFVAPEAKPRVTLPSQNAVACEAEEEEEGMSNHARSREERLMRFCPEVVNPAFSQEVKAVRQKSLVRGASKVLAEHRGHRLNRERFRRKAENEESVMDDQQGLRLALHLHARSQQRYRRGCPATPPLQGVPLRPGSCVRQSPDFCAMRKALPGKAAFAKRKKPKKQALERPAAREKPGSRTNSPHLYEPVPCSFECRNWRTPSPLQVRLEQGDGVVVSSQWRDFLEDLRLSRLRGPKKAAKPCAHSMRSSQELELSQEEQLKSKESLESGKVQDCPDAHAFHLVRQGRLQALERWGGIQFVRPSMLRHLLFHVAKNGPARMLQYLLENMRKNHPDALHWREQGKTGCTLLHVAAQADMLPVCALLEELGADLEATDEAGKQAIEVAGPFCKETFNIYASFRVEDKSQQLGSTLRITSSTLQTISERPMSRSATLKMSNTLSVR